MVLICWWLLYLHSALWLVNCYVITSFQGTAHVSHRLSSPIPKSRTRPLWFSSDPIYIENAVPYIYIWCSVHDIIITFTARRRIVNSSKKFSSAVHRRSQLYWHAWPVDMDEVHIHTISEMFNTCIYQTRQLFTSYMHFEQHLGVSAFNID